MDFQKFTRLVEERTGFRTMPDATASGEYFSDSCGDMYSFFLKVGPGAVIEDISYFTTGCGFGTATCSLVVDLARGRTVDEAVALNESEIDAALGGYPEKKRDYPQRALEALRIAIEDYRTKVASGAVPDYAAMAPTGVHREPPTVVPAAQTDRGGKLLIKLH
ncbi:MAG: iron-sulfur cluster assembly scaffold protein [Bacillati bacterium]